MNFAEGLRPGAVVAAVLLLTPMLVAAFAPGTVDDLGRKLPRIIRISAPALLCVPYALTSRAFGVFHWTWLVVYALLPVAVAFLLHQARNDDPKCRGTWRDYGVLLALGLAVDLRWLEPAWPQGLAALGKMLLLDAGIFGFLVVRGLHGVGFDLRLTRKDLARGGGEYLLYAVIAVPLGLWLGFLRFHAVLPSPLRAITAFIFTFVFIAIPEELFFRGWLQNLLERRMGRTVALIATAILFGLAHWNKRTLHFNWRYVLMAAIAGIFYGRAWRAQRRVGASALTHSLVDTTWSLWLR
ncbi:CPBP family intramembrane glutamic endopeptidase [Occallatibacter savannae]|uniref:CPBP family intramembrane glutamic endopeptidase n=1 Tax=Occallatibacter savannae TaxID=1002691 RepID=UPI000D692C79|nr:CPBP family intramembrane glutamic endopeptidase [Occallatibacter savannae]